MVASLDQPCGELLVEPERSNSLDPDIRRDAGGTYGGAADRKMLAIASGRGWAPDHDPRLRLREARLNRVLVRSSGRLLPRSVLGGLPLEPQLLAMTHGFVEVAG